MSWLHIGSYPRSDDGSDWLVVTGIDAPVFDWALRTSVPSDWLVRLPTFSGWIVRREAEGYLWAVVSECCDLRALCAHCLHHADPCDSWVRLVSRRYQHAEQKRRDELQLATAREQSRRERERAQWDRMAARDAYQPPPPRSRRDVRPPPPPPADPKSEAAKALGVTWPRDRAEVKRAFKRAALRSHPDLGGSDATMIAVIRARDTLLAAC